MLLPISYLIMIGDACRTNIIFFRGRHSSYKYTEHLLEAVCTVPGRGGGGKSEKKRCTERVSFKQSYLTVYYYFLRVFSLAVRRNVRQLLQGQLFFIYSIFSTVVSRLTEEKNAQLCYPLCCCKYSLLNGMYVYSIHKKCTTTYIITTLSNVIQISRDFFFLQNKITVKTNNI